jgi:hypothetical protein
MNLAFQTMSNSKIHSVFTRSDVLAKYAFARQSFSRLTSELSSLQSEFFSMLLVFDCHATTPFDFFSATYFFKARRLFCLLRLREFFRASCFMLILLVRRDKPGGLFADGSSARRRVRHPRRT